MSNFFLLVKCIQGLFLLYRVAILHSFLLLNDIPLYVCAVTYLSTHLVMDICVVSSFWLFQIVLL